MKYENYSSFALAAACLVASANGVVQQVGDKVCYEGYVMDLYCSEVGFFPHSTIRTLHAPADHTVHCLIDDVLCIQSGFELLQDPTTTTTDSGTNTTTSPYCRAYRLNQAGNDMVVELAKAIGVCTDCNADTTGEWVKGFRVTVHGTIQQVGSEFGPAVLDVTQVLESSVGCTDAEFPQTEPDFCKYERASLEDSESPCHWPDDYCKNLGEVKPGTTPEPDDEENEDNNSSGTSHGLIASHPSLLMLSGAVVSHMLWNLL